MSRIDVCGSVSRVHISKIPGKLEVLDPEDETSSKKSRSRKTCIFDSQDFTNKQPINSQNGNLQVLGPTENVFICSAEAASRPGSSASRKGSAGRKCHASTKQISLRTVKRIALSHDIPDYNVADLKNSTRIEMDSTQKKLVLPNTAVKESTEVHSASIHIPSITEQPQESSSDEDGSDSGKTTAPIELLAEFIKAVMEGDYKLSWKLCQMILIYEPENPEANEFSPLIQKMLKNDEDQVTDEEDSENTDEDDDDSSDTDDSDSNSTETSEESSEDETDG
ncbi:glutamate-rich protein 2 isoform X2 [Pyxicephalus adspersus]|uniref:glutamate-rich protein 2 isoform X2 n=1 Tax=Pyxicephalus adspersus TaxID=30357 RepID=UPI003B5C2EBE